jgi:sugar lactone lactonase YvrE
MCIDSQGNPWLTWGSYWGGIKLAELDPDTGKLITYLTAQFFKSILKAFSYR